MSLTTSVSIVEDILNFVDEFVKRLTKYKFSHKKAFHVTTFNLSREFLSRPLFLDKEQSKLSEPET